MAGGQSDQSEDRTTPEAVDLESVQEQLRALQAGRLSGEIRVDLVEEALNDLAASVEALTATDAELRRLSEQLVESGQRAEHEEQRWRETFERIPEPLIVTSTTGEIREANAAASGLLEVASETLAGKPIDALVPSDARERFRADLESLLANGRVDDWVVPFTPRHGSSVEVDVTASVEPPTEGTEATIFWLLRNRSARSRSQIAMRKAQDDLQRRLVERTAQLEWANSWKDELLQREQEATSKLEQSMGLLDALLSGAPVGLAFLDRDLRFVRVNDHFATLTGRPAEDHVGRTLREAIGDFADHLEPIYRRVIASGEPSSDVDITGEVPGAPGEVRHWRASYYPVRGSDGEVVGVGVVVGDVTERRRQEARLRAQYAVQRALAEADSIEAAAPRVLAAVCETLRWDVGGLWLVDADANVIRCLEMWRRSPKRHAEFETASRIAAYERGVGIPGRVWAAAEPVWIEDVTEESNFPRAGVAREGNLHGALAFPITIGSEVVGVLEFFSRRIRPPDEDILEMVGSVGSQVGQFLRRTRVERQGGRLLDAERAARRDAEAANERLRVIQRVTEGVLQHVGLDDLLHELLQRIRPLFKADAATVLLLAEGGEELVVRSAVGREEERVEALRIPVGQGVSGRIAAEGRPMIIDDVRALRPVSQYLREKISSLVGVPLVVADRVIGVLHVATKEPRQFTDDDVTLLELVGDRVALAVEQVNLYESEAWARREAERAAERTASLQRVTAALAETRSADDVAQAIIEYGVSSAGASSVWVARLDQDRGELGLLASDGYDDELRESLRTVRLEDELPLAEAVRSGRPVYFGTKDELLAAYPGLAEISERLGRGGLAAFPLAAEGRRFGGVLLGFTGTKAFDPPERAFLRALAQQCAQALERATLYEAEQEARSEAEAARRRLSFMLEATTVLSSTLDFPETLEGLGRVAVSRLGDICLIDVLRDDDSIERLVAVHRDPAKQELTGQLRTRFAPDPVGPHPAVAVIRSGQSRYSPTMTEEFLRRTTRDEEHFQLTQTLGFQSYMSVPLAVHGRVLGTITMVSTDPGRRYGPDDVALAEELAGRAALAVDNARLYRERDYVARTLQSALLPPEIPQIPGMEVAARYRPAGEGAEVGGDFYDVFWALGGWGLLVGDVRGKGPDAAAVMGMIRHSLRAAALQERLPSRILRVINDALRQQTGEERFATLTYVRLEAAGAGVQMTVSSGGHPLPILMQRDGSLRAVGHPGVLLGPFPDPWLDDQRAALSPGDTLVLYTDGVTERRRGEEFFGEHRLAELLRSSVGMSAATIAERIEQAVDGFGPDAPRDDIAILALKVTDWGVAAEPPR
ncbi:MAG TPA: GAF domain-containing protein [Actinomycetota bacterium]|nr:GAF domain-containing protein [Actinomycetota bacterium]